MLRSPILALALSTALAAGLGGALVAPAMASPPSSRTLVVDDDGAQCGRHAYSRIQAAVDAAHRGDRVRVCPGRYAERVVVNKPLTLTGRPAAVAALDCFTEQTSEPDDLDTTVVPVLEPPDAEETPVLRLTADRIEVAGLVIQGVDDQEADIGDGYLLFDAALTTDDTHTGWRIHHNLFRLNYLAVELGSKGGPESRFDHNCLRDNAYSVANQRYTLSRALLDHNETYRSQLKAWEIGWGYQGHHRGHLGTQHLAADRRLPAVPEGQNEEWARPANSCTLPVNLDQRARLRPGINAPKFRNFPANARSRPIPGRLRLHDLAEVSVARCGFGQPISNPPRRRTCTALSLMGLDITNFMLEVEDAFEHRDYPIQDYGGLATVHDLCPYIVQKQPGIAYEPVLEIVRQLIVQEFAVKPQNVQPLSRWIEDLRLY